MVSMIDSKQIAQLQVVALERRRAARELQRRIELTRELSEADARLARALNEIGAPRARPQSGRLSA